MKDERSQAYIYAPDVVAAYQKELQADPDFVEWDFDDQNVDEVGDAYRLVQLGVVGANVFNSTEWMKEISARFKNPAEIPTQMSALVDCFLEDAIKTTRPTVEIETNHDARFAGAEELGFLNQYWEHVGQGRGNFRQMMNDLPSTVAQTPLHLFLHFVYSGMPPTPECMLAVAKAFKLYFAAEGELSLEDVFFGRPRKRSGTYARQAPKDSLYLFFHDTVARTRSLQSAGGKKQDSLETIAYYFLLNHTQDDEGELIENFDEDSFTRGYRRWKKDNPEIADKYPI